ncbi:MAG: hypothetical protein LBI96_05045 [Odoribacteraceae bacterium]|jgi:outer membrane protein OmpA-like peptidoglycan-associated protein|nr:hypothetical protein [Odoribacteraceae bacterium]
MKTTILFTTLLAAASVTARAGDRKTGLQIAETRIEKSGENLEIRFTIATAKRTVTPGNTLYLSPVVTRGQHRATLPIIVIQNRVAATAQQRHEWAAGTRFADRETFRVRPGTPLTYTATAPYQPWMENATLTLEGITVGCCTTPRPTRAITIAKVKIATILAIETPASEKQATEQPVIEQPTIEQPATVETAPAPPPAIHFRQGSRTIDTLFADNASAIRSIIDTLRALQTTTGKKITGLIIAGFASPEGAPATNRGLARDRAEALRRLIARHTALSPGCILTLNGQVDWKGLIALVAASGDPRESDIRKIIDDTLAGKNTDEEAIALLKNIDGGTTYRALHATHFPRLRRATHVKINIEQQ